MINLANKELYYADSLKVTDEASLRNIGEAHFFRAYSYFELVKAYGEVPLIDFYYTNPADGLKPKAKVEDLYNLIVADLDVAAQYLPLNWQLANGTNQYPGRLTKGAAHTLKAQVYAFRQDVAAGEKWTQVKNACDSVILSGQYQLATKFTDIWKDGLDGDGKNGTESIFEMQAYVGENGKMIKALSGEQARMYARAAHLLSGTWAGAGIHQQITL